MKDKYNLNEQVVSVIKSSIPLGGNMINELMELLPIGREAIYRRLRGEVPFTFEEIAKVSLKMRYTECLHNKGYKLFVLEVKQY